MGFAAADPPLDLSVKGLVDLRVLSAFVGSVGFDGNADVDARVGGVMSKPEFGGQIGLKDAEIAISEPRLVLSELTGPITMSGQTLLIENLRGSANGGNLALDGALQVEGLCDYRRRAQHPGAGGRPRDSQGAAQRGRCAHHLPSRSRRPRR